MANVWLNLLFASGKAFSHTAERTVLKMIDKTAEVQKELGVYYDRATSFTGPEENMLQVLHNRVEDYDVYAEVCSPCNNDDSNLALERYLLSVRDPLVQSELVIDGTDTDNSNSFENEDNTSNPLNVELLTAELNTITPFERCPHKQFCTGRCRRGLQEKNTTYDVNISKLIVKYRQDKSKESTRAKRNVQTAMVQVPSGAKRQLHLYPALTEMSLVDALPNHHKSTIVLMLPYILKTIKRKEYTLFQGSTSATDTHCFTNMLAEINKNLVHANNYRTKESFIASLHVAALWLNNNKIQPQKLKLLARSGSVLESEFKFIVNCNSNVKLHNNKKLQCGNNCCPCQSILEPLPNLCFTGMEHDPRCIISLLKICKIFQQTNSKREPSSATCL